MFQVTHFIVNHSKTFKDPETGACTNNCQGIHGIIKQDGHAQFGRLPYLNAAGQTYYLDLLVWSAIKRLQKMGLFVAFLTDLWIWTLYPFEDFKHIIPVFKEVDKSEEEGYEEKPDDEEWLILAD